MSRDSPEWRVQRYNIFLDFANLLIFNKLREWHDFCYKIVEMTKNDKGAAL